MAKTILLSGFDPFLGGTGNNSTVIGKKLVQRFQGTDINVKFCPLRTVYYKASESLKDCINALDEKPDFVISLGEVNCRDVKIETRAVNLMKDYGGDNDGVHHTGSPIRPEGSQYVPMTLDLTPYRAMLKRRERKYVKISQDAGTFVCNNTAYIMASDIDIPYTFIHVPGHKCPRNQMLINRSVNILEKTFNYLINDSTSSL